MTTRPDSVERDLLKAFDEVNNTFFDGAVCAGIGWRKLRPRKKFINVGLCSINERFIEINEALKDKRIPYWFLKFIIYHEILHLFHGVGHSTQFKEQEKQHPDYQEAENFFENKLEDIVSDWHDWYEHQKETRNEKRKGKNIDHDK